ncbi:hypothetical protein BZG36_01681 [Bifiguratus adelaidae]|uniref:Phosphotransferase n=1 Tax=Bifiguratus adelaidae TaxID=1938954 RepID=A0A261Y4N2_9FUNG|nr:hypothetical protein BZG36_01681 [Bifiguratus adelaidae]
MDDLEKGLAKEKQTLAMIPSFVEGRLTGNEVGPFLALDLGDTNLRVVKVDLQGHGKYTTRSSKYKVRECLKTEGARKLFNFIADCVDSFVSEHGLDKTEENIPLGFTFSFPVLQTKVNRGIFLSWIKGFACPGLVGKDPVVMLQDARNEKNCNVYIAANINYTVGTLLSHAYAHPDTLIGVILGTGSNGTYIEKMSNIKKWDGSKTDAPDIIINTEFGILTMNVPVLPRTPYDNKLGRKSINPRTQIFE